MGERWFHGGTPGLRRGAWLLPPAQTGYRKGRTEAADALGIDGAAWLGPEIDRDDRVYLTTSRRMARAYAMACIFNLRAEPLAYGALYTAEPDGAAEPDPDLPDGPGGRFLQCERARILAVYDPVIRPDTGYCLKVLAEGIGPATWAELAGLQQQARRR